MLNQTHLDLKPEELEPLIADALYGQPVDYQEQIKLIREQKRIGNNCGIAGVLLLIQYQPEQGYVFLLNKRSAKVQQPGDLCCPGGGSNPLLDGLLSRLFIRPLLAWQKHPGYLRAKKLNPRLLNHILFFLTNALRESWEEIRLNPWGVNFLGPLRSYQLTLFRNIIFPLVGSIKRDKLSLRPNWEVAKILRIPLSSFFAEENYGIYRLKVERPVFKDILQSDTVDHPCFLYRETTQSTEILWGATYNIIMDFLATVFAFHPPQLNTRPVVEGVLYPLS
jgi:hypothetical protein